MTNLKNNKSIEKKKILAEGLITSYQQDKEFAMKIEMLLPYLSFVPENDVIDSFIMIMEEYHNSLWE